MSKSAAVVSAYWALYRLWTGTRAERLRAQEAERNWAWDAVEDAVRSGQPDVLTLLDDLLASSEADACYLGAGPVEELLVHHGAAFDEAIADRCRRSQAWCTAVSCVWLNDSDAVALVAVRPFLASGERG